MGSKGLLIDYQWCTGCQSCEIACRNEHGWDLNHHGIKVLELGPFDYEDNGKVDWSFIATPTTLCDLCEERVEAGGVPSCQLHCLAGVIEFGSVEDLAKKMAEKQGRVTIFTP